MVGLLYFHADSCQVPLKLKKNTMVYLIIMDYIVRLEK